MSISQELNSPRMADTSLARSRNDLFAPSTVTMVTNSAPSRLIYLYGRRRLPLRGRISGASSDHKIKSFDVSTGSQLAELQVHGDGEVVSISLATNGKFLATFTQHSLSFWDTPTLTRIGPVIEDSQSIQSIALSPDCSYLTTGGFDGNITIRNLNNILPDLGTFHVSIRAFRILSDKLHTVFPLRFASTSGTCATVSWV